MTNNKQQTAVDSIIELCQELLGNHYSISHDGVCSEIITFCQEQAKEMEKEQKKECWDVAHQAGRFEGKGIAEENWQTFEQYYNETYGGGEQ
jgi:hypothetical protein